MSKLTNFGEWTADSVRITAIIARMSKSYKAIKEGKEPEPLRDEDIATLERVAGKLGWPINIVAHAQETLFTLEKLEPYVCNCDPKDVVPICYQESPTVAELIAIDPLPAWEFVGQFMPEGEFGTREYWEAEWTCGVFVALAEEYKYRRAKGEERLSTAQFDASSVQLN